MKDTMRVLIIASQAPFAAKVASEPGWMGYAGDFCILLMLGMLGMMAWDKLRAAKRTVREK